jgi:hypothetical protein
VQIISPRLGPVAGIPAGRAIRLALAQCCSCLLAPGFCRICAAVRAWQGGLWCQQEGRAVTADVFCVAGLGGRVVHRQGLSGLGGRVVHRQGLVSSTVSGCDKVPGTAHLLARSMCVAVQCVAQCCCWQILSSYAFEVVLLAAFHPLHAYCDWFCFLCKLDQPQRAAAHAPLHAALALMSLTSDLCSIMHGNHGSMAVACELPYHAQQSPMSCCAGANPHRRCADGTCTCFSPLFTERAKVSAFFSPVGSICLSRDNAVE